MVMGIVYWTLMIGFVVGALSKFFVHEMKQGEVFSTMTVGLIGAVAGGWLGSKTGLYRYGETNGLIASLIMAVISVGIYIVYFKKSHPHSN